VPLDRLLRRPLIGRDRRHPPSDEVAVHLPDLTAGCSMADMADLSNRSRPLGKTFRTHRYRRRDARDLHQLRRPTSKRSAVATGHCLHELKRRAGMVVPSAPSRVLFFPDQHLGRNTARTWACLLGQMPVWDPREPLGREHSRPDHLEPGPSSGEATARSTRCSNPNTSTSSAPVPRQPDPCAS
jgi:hypothetical protein